MNEQVDPRYWTHVAALATGQEADRDLIWELQAESRERIFAGDWPSVEERIDLEATDPRVQVIVDCLQALSMIKDDDPAYPWMRGGLLAQVGRYGEAAQDFLLVFDRIERMRRAGENFDRDEEDWPDAALYHAARNLSLSGQALSAASLLTRLSQERQALLQPLMTTS